MILGKLFDQIQVRGGRILLQNRHFQKSDCQISGNESFQSYYAKYFYKVKTMKS